MSFPRARFLAAGADVGQVDAVQAAFDGLPTYLQEAVAAKWATVANADLAEQLAHAPAADDAAADPPPVSTGRSTPIVLTGSDGAHIPIVITPPAEKADATPDGS